jgi:hypothetical protein
MIGALALFAAAPLAAQGRFRTGDILRTGDVIGTQRDTVQNRKSEQNRRKSDHIPPGQLPPAGMCRIWIDGVPPGQQPAPTDCQTAVATKPANARVIWGDQTAFPGNGKGKVNKGKSGKHSANGDDRDDDEHENDFDRGRDVSRKEGKSLAKRGKKG